MEALIENKAHSTPSAQDKVTRAKKILESTRYHSLEAAHIYESAFGDVEVADWLAKTLLSIREIARIAYAERRASPELAGAPDDLNGFIRWVIKRSNKLSPENRHAARIFVLEQQAMGVYLLGKAPEREGWR